MKPHIKVKSGDEHDAFSGWRRLLCVFKNHTGIVKKQQRSYNKRLRQQHKHDIDTRLHTITCDLGKYRRIK